MLNILLINISLRPESRLKLFPIGIGYIATAIKKAGFDFDLLDIDAHRYSDDEVENLIKKRKYDVVAMGCIVTGYTKVKKICAVTRKHHPSACIVVGNSVATSIYKTLLNKTEADVAVMGEGDITIVDLLHALEKGRTHLDKVDGICYKDESGKIIVNRPRSAISDISSLPHIDFDLFDIDIYIENSKEQISENSCPVPREKIRGLPINTARGCVGNCTFCYHNFRGYKYRYRSMDSIVDEIRDMIEKYQLNYIMFGDELTLFSRYRAKEFVEGIANSGLKFYWGVTCRADLFNKEDDIELLKRFHQAGCMDVAFSLESSNYEILKAMNKHITVEQFMCTARMVHNAGMTPRTSLVIGYPTENPDTIQDTFRVCAEARIYPSAGFLLPQPGSVMYDYACEHGFIQDEETYLMKMGDRQDLRVNMTTMSDDEMESEVLKGLSMCNDVLHVGLDKNNLIKTQHYRKAK